MKGVKSVLLESGSWAGIEEYEWMKGVKGLLLESGGWAETRRIWMNEGSEECFVGEWALGWEWRMWINEGSEGLLLESGVWAGRWIIWMNEGKESSFVGEWGLGWEMKSMNEWREWIVFCWRVGVGLGVKNMKGVKQGLTSLRESPVNDPLPSGRGGEIKGTPQQNLVDIVSWWGGVHPEVGQAKSGMTPSKTCVDVSVFGALNVCNAV